jgi:hypothetical protein
MKPLFKIVNPGNLERCFEGVMGLGESIKALFKNVKVYVAGHPLRRVEGGVQ